VHDLTKIDHPDGHRWTSASCGESHLILIGSNGDAYGSGYNYYGQLGLGDTSDRSVPTKINHPGGFQWTSASCGLNHTILIDSNGDAYGCGYNYYRPLCISDQTERVSTLTKIASVRTDGGLEVIGGPIDLNCDHGQTIQLRNGGSPVAVVEYYESGGGWYKRFKVESGSYLFAADGRIYKSDGSQIYADGSSDDRLKLNEKYITDSSCLLKLKPQLYDKLKKLQGDHDKTTIEAGLIAQEIWYDCPELRHLVIPGSDANVGEHIQTSSDPSVDPDYSSWGSDPAQVLYNGFIPYLIRGFQEHSEKVDTLEKENETMKDQIALLMKACGLTESGNVDS
jgi:hypothetical protein